MNRGQTIFAQLMDLLPLAKFRRCVDLYRGDYKVQSFPCPDQFSCLAFAQLTYDRQGDMCSAHVEIQCGGVE